MDASKLTPGQRAYEAKRAAKAGQSWEVWMRDKEKRAQADAKDAAKPVAAPKKSSLFARLMERAQKPLG